MAEKQKYFIVNRAAQKAEIMIYGYIGDYDVSANAFVKELKALEATYKKIDVRINSGGGSVFDGIAIYNAIKNSSADINTYIDGLAASMASIIALAGKRVYMSRNASMMTHKPSVYANGNSEDLKRNANLLDELEKTAAIIYSEKTGKSTDDCKALYMNGRDNWFTAQQAIDEGLADELYDLAPVKHSAKARTEIMAYHEYAMQLGFDSAQPTQNNPTDFKTQENKMKEIVLTAEQLAQMGLTGLVTIDQVIATYKANAEAAAKVPTLQASLSKATSDKEKAVQDFADYKKAEAETKIADLLAAKVKDTSITQEQSNVFAAQFKGRYDDLKAVIATMKPYKSIVGEIEAGGNPDELKALMAQSGQELFKNGGFDRLKAIAPEQFKTKYKEWKGEEWKD